MKTPEQINRLIAESGLFQYPEIIPMGGEWKIHKPNTPYYQEFYEDFDPYHRIEHAEMALDKFNHKLHKIQIGNAYFEDTDWWCTIDKHLGYADTLSAAISEAIKVAVEGKE